MPTALTSSTGEERALASELRSGDEESLARFQERLGPALFHYLSGRFGSLGLDAEDLYQETLIKVWRGADAYDPSQGSLRAWAFAIARNLGIDALRRSPEARARLERAFRTFARLDQRFKAYREAVEDALGRDELPPLGRRIVEADLAAFPESDDAALAVELDTSPGSIQAQRSKAYKRLGLRALRRRDALGWFAEDGQARQARLLGLRSKGKKEAPRDA